MPDANKPKRDPRESDRNYAPTGYFRQQGIPSPARSTTRGADSSRSADGADGRVNSARKEEQRHLLIARADVGFRPCSVSSHQHGSARDSDSQDANSRGIVDHDGRVGDRQSNTRAWLSVPQAYEIGMGREQRDEDRRRLYSLVQAVGLEDGGNGQRGSAWSGNTMHRLRGPSATKDNRCFELGGVGAWTETCGSERTC